MKIPPGSHWFKAWQRFIPVTLIAGRHYLDALLLSSFNLSLPALVFLLLIQLQFLSRDFSGSNARLQYQIHMRLKHTLPERRPGAAANQ